MVSNLLLSDEGSALLFVVIISIVKICLVSISYDRSISNLVMPFYIISCSMHIIKSFTIKVEDLKILEEDHDVQQTVLILMKTLLHFGVRLSSLIAPLLTTCAT